MIVLGLTVLLASIGPSGLDAQPVEGLGPGESRPVPLRADGGRSLEHRSLTLHGLPLRGGYETVERTAEGDERVIGARRPKVPARLRPEAARLSVEAVARWLEARELPPPAEPPRLVYRLVLGTPVLAWEVRLPLRTQPSPSLRTLWIGAASGRLVDEHDAVFSSQARVFAEDPSTTPDPVDVTLATHDVDEPGWPLRSAQFEVFGCGGEPNDEAPPWASSFGCIPRQLARSDEAGDYVVPLPDLGRIEDNRSPDDAYAEVATYYYAERFFEVMEQRGLEGRRCEHFTMAVNIHSRDEDGVVSGMDGATYIDQCNPDVAPQIVFGQGKDADYAWDSGIVFHELGHSVIQDLAPEGLASRRYAPHGIVSEAGAINEGLADYWAMTVGDDPYVAEYVGRFSVASAQPYLGTGLNERVCPTDLIGEWHHDGKPLGAALWAMRTRLGAQRVDALILRTLPRLPPDAMLDDFGSTLLDEATRDRDAGVLDDAELELVRRTLDARGLVECLHVVDDLHTVTTGKRTALAPARDDIEPFFPAGVQLRYDVPEDAHEVTIQVALGGGEPEERQVSVLLRRDGEPVEFEYDTRPATEDEDADEVIVVTAHYDLDVELQWLNGEDFVARVPVEPGEVLHVAIANRSPIFLSSTIFIVASEPMASDEEEDDEPESGCGCRSAGSASPWWSLMLPLLVRRRARRR